LNVELETLLYDGTNWDETGQGRDVQATEDAPKCVYIRKYPVAIDHAGQKR
jgi:hypothetical protein